MQNARDKTSADAPELNVKGLDHTFNYIDDSSMLDNSPVHDLLWHAISYRRDPDTSSHQHWHERTGYCNGSSSCFDRQNFLSLTGGRT